MLYGMPACKYNGKLKKAKKVPLLRMETRPVVLSLEQIAGLRS